MECLIDKMYVMKTTYETLSIAVNALQKKGYTENFELIENGIENKAKKQLFNADFVKVTEVHRFEGYTNPADSSVLYALETTSGVKGLLIDAYGAYAENVSNAMAKKLHLQAHS